MRRSVAVIILSQGKFFVAKRPSGGALGMMWEFPGGKVEEGETDEEAIVREMDEEFGATVIPIRFLGQTEFLHRGKSRELAAWIVALGIDTRMELREHTECRWVDFGDFAALQLAPGGRVVAGELGEHAMAGKIDAGIPGIGEVEVFRGEPGEGEGGGHAATFLAQSGGEIDVLVDGAEGVIQVAEAIREQTSGGGLEGFRDDFTHLLENQRRGEIPRIAAAHAIRNGKNQVVAGQRMAAVCRKYLRPSHSRGKGNERIVVAGLAGAAVGAGVPVEERSGGHESGVRR